MVESKLLVFGPQALSFSAASFESLRAKLEQDDLNTWALDVLSTVPAMLALLSTKIPKLQILDQQNLLKSLIKALRTGEHTHDFFPLPNTLLSPLVVISHVAEYFAFVKAVKTDLHSLSRLPASVTDNTETLGLCTGVLSAFAVKAASSVADLKRCGAAAVRLAALSGALVDAEDASRPAAERSTSFSASWAAASMTGLETVLQKFPEAYMSVRMDEKRATITCTMDEALNLRQALENGGIHVSAVALNGRFHWPSHKEDVEKMIEFANKEPDLQLVDGASTVLPSGSLHELALRAILTDQSLWYQTCENACMGQLYSHNTKVVCFGSERCLPPTLARKLDSRLIHITDAQVSAGAGTGSVQSSSSRDTDNHIAVIGMSCHVPNAEDLDAFWQVLLSGESQHREVPTERFSMKSHFREMDPNRKWYGNFINNHDTFDHKFFKKSPREMGSTDPQHRVALQLAYQAVQQSGYFGVPGFDKHIGVYIGHANTDYEHNIRSYPANAYSATGNLKSLLAGKISHYFGWTGPSLTLDTACSSSSVAVHLACRAILSGEITGALAGGVNILTSPEWYHNLAGASFLSPTGQCKSFDARGDGYCRGEGSGVVFLKKLSAALADGDQVLGVIASTSVLQNQNCTPITVPNSTSLDSLFRDVINRAGMKPSDISVVEAHGTGTPVGDPAEYDGIRRVLGGSNRADKLSLTAVKGSIGHLEVASGVASLIKVLLMIHEAAVPPQASFQTINPDLSAKPADNIVISTTIKPWTAPVKAALINNYGASGSNASMVVMEPPKLTTQGRGLASVHAGNRSFPFWFSGADDNSLRANAAKMESFLNQKSASGSVPALANLSFQVARQSNRTLAKALVLTATSVEDLRQKLSGLENGGGAISSRPLTARQVIMCFGGQVSTFVGLDRDVFDNVAILRKHLDECDASCQALGYGSIYPAIFQKTPLLDIVKLQTALFAMQYACAMSWIDCGVQVTAIVGHSFGELTCLCISGVLSLRDAVKLIGERATIIQQSWPAEKGAMMAAEGDFATVNHLVAAVHEKSGLGVSIACYNGPTSYTIAGPVSAIQLAEQMAKTDAVYRELRVKMLRVTNAFHCGLVDAVEEELLGLGQSLNFCESKIRFERATEQHENNNFGDNCVARHLRNPVYFHHAVRRLSDEYPNAIWLEAGSNSTVTNMAKRAISGTSNNAFFQSVNITGEASYDVLVDTTTKLWHQGLDITFWAHHKSQISDYSPILLPPYQFEKSRHWLEIKDVPTVSPSAATLSPAPHVEPEKGLFTFKAFLDDTKRSMRFRINTTTPEFKRMVDAHIMASTVAVMPGMLPVEIAIDALSTLRTEFQDCKFQPELQGLVYYSPLVPQHCSAVWLDVQSLDSSGLAWEWKFIAENSKGISTTHMSGSIIFYEPTNAAVQSDFARLSRLGSHKRCKLILDGGEADDVVVGRNIYRAFEAVIDYKDLYRHLARLVGKNGDSAGRVTRAHDKQGWLDSVLTDCFCQVAGIAVNLFSDSADFVDRGIYIGDRVDRWIRAPGLFSDPDKPQEWEVFAMSSRESEASFVSDVFAFDARNGRLYEAILGIRYSKVPMAGIRKALNRAIAENPSDSTQMPFPTPNNFTAPFLGPLPVTQDHTAFQAPIINGVSVGGTDGAQDTQKPTRADNGTSRSDVPAKAKDILSNLSGVEADDIRDDSDLVEMGIDSLMAMELIREVDAAFKCTLATEQLMGLTDFRSLVVCISTALDAELGGNTDSGYDSDPAPQTNAGDRKLLNGTAVSNEVNGVGQHEPEDVGLPSSAVLNVLRSVKAQTDEFISNYKMRNYYSQVRPMSTMLCAAYIVEAFDKLGCPLQRAQPGQRLAQVAHLPKHKKFMAELYKIIGPDEVGLVDIVGSDLVRTGVPCPDKPAAVLLQEALEKEPDHAAEFKLSALTGSKLAECLTGKEDGLQIIFGSAEGRRTVSDVYAIAPLNHTWIKQAEFFIQQLLQRLPRDYPRIKILEMGAGTGGTTATIVPMLAALGVPVTYTFTDLSSSLVAAARKRFKQYPFMEFKVVNIEATPDSALMHSQHIILANACVHATRSLPISLGNIHKLLRSDGMLMLLEETEQLPWVDFVFGLLEGWWLFEDGRVHAQVSAEHWEKVLRGAGFAHVDYTDGSCREAQVQRIIFGFPSDIRYAGSAEEPCYPIHLRHAELTSIVDRQAVIDGFIRKYTASFRPLAESSQRAPPDIIGTSTQFCVLVTGATGSLGSHIVSAAAQMPNVVRVLCLNRPGTMDATTRQEEAFTKRGITLETAVASKLQILAADTSKPLLGLSMDTYKDLVQSVTHIVHNAWPMSLTRSTTAYESQFQVMRNLMDLARECITHRPPPFRFSFQFISSIGAVGYYPLWSGRSVAPETPTTADTALPVGYADAKIVCERILQDTLCLYPDRFRGMAVRIAQITGSRTNGYWNPMEHFSFFVKSARLIRSLPDLQGTLSWSPVNDVANALLDLLISTNNPYLIYHIENPVRQPWPEMIQLLANELDIPRENIIPYNQWLNKIENCDASAADNPAKQLMTFWETHFLRMSTGPLILDTSHSREHSKSLRESKPVGKDLVKQYIQQWNQFFL